MTTVLNAKTLQLKANCDEGLPGDEHFEIVESKVDHGALEEGEICVSSMVMSVDPYLRGGIKTGRGKKPGDVMTGFVAGKVIASNNKEWVVGDLYGAALPFSTYQIVSAKAIKATVMWKLTGKVTEDKISCGIGILGMPGATSYGGLIDVLKPIEGQTIFVSGAAGAVGSVVGMLAKNVYKCKVIGSCGGPEKCKMVEEKFGFDATIDYKKCKDREALTAALKEKAPDGIDMYFDNVGSMHFEAAFDSLRPHGRIAVCGGISNYNLAKPPTCAIDPMAMIYSFQRIEGFVCQPWLSGAKGNFHKDMPGWLKEGKVVVQETHFKGIENWPTAFKGLFTGANKGKAVVLI